jgi:RTX calcium-binding nonapeptide repeat (4 copies)
VKGRTSDQLLSRLARDPPTRPYASKWPKEAILSGPIGLVSRALCRIVWPTAPCAIEAQCSFRRYETSEIEIHVNAGSGSDVVIIEGTALRDFLVAGADGLNINRDSDADVFLSATDIVAMFGNGGNDVLTARGGFGTGGAAGRNAVLVGRGGNDRLLGGPDRDDLVGGRGRDISKGGRGRDSLLGQGDADRLFGQGQNDALSGGGGHDRLVGGSGTDTCRQGPGTGPIRSCEET